MDFQRARARVFHRNGLAHLVALVLNRHHQFTAEVTFHPAGDLLAVCQRDGDRFPGGKGRIHGKPDAHFAVKAQHRQGPMLQHDGLHPVALLGVDQLHPASGGGGNLRRRFFIGGGFHLFSHRGHGILNFRNGGHDADLIHCRKRVALADKITVIYQKFFNLHIRRNADILGISGFQCAAAVDGGADGADRGIGTEDAGLGAVVLLLLPGHQGHQRQPEGKQRQYAPEDIPLY